MSMFCLPYLGVPQAVFRRNRLNGRFRQGTPRSEPRWDKLDTKIVRADHDHQMKFWTSFVESALTWMHMSGSFLMLIILRFSFLRESLF